MFPAFVVIGDSLAFSLRDVRSGRTGDPLPGVTVTYALLDAKTRAAVPSASGSMSQYSDDPVSFEAVISGSFLTGLTPRREYLLRTTINDGGVTTTHAATLVALTEPPTRC